MPLAVATYTIWGLLPLYFRLLHGVPAVQVLANRVLWSLGILAVVVLAARRGAAIRAAARGRTLALLGASATLISVNWLIYIWAVQHAHVLEASLGYFINPLVNVALGVVVLREAVGRIQGIAIAVAAAGVAVMAASGGVSLWIALALATTFGLYGLVRKVVAIDALGGLTIETLMLAPLAAAVLVHATLVGDAAFGHDLRLDALLAFTGALTAAPLLMFAAAARGMPYATLGLIQYLSPTLQFAEAVLLFGEPLRPPYLLAFALIWTGCALYAWGSLRGTR